MTREEYIQLYELLGKFEEDNIRDNIRNVDLYNAKDKNDLLKLLAEKQLSDAVKLIKDVAVYGF